MFKFTEEDRNFFWAISYVFCYFICVAIIGIIFQEVFNGNFTREAFTKAISNSVMVGIVLFSTFKVIKKFLEVPMRFVSLALIIFFFCLLFNISYAKKVNMGNNYNQQIIAEDEELNAILLNRK